MLLCLWLPDMLVCIIKIHWIAINGCIACPFVGGYLRRRYRMMHWADLVRYESWALYLGTTSCIVWRDIARFWFEVFLRALTAICDWALADTNLGSPALWWGVMAFWVVVADLEGFWVTFGWVLCSDQILEGEEWVLPHYWTASRWISPHEGRWGG